MHGPVVPRLLEEAVVCDTVQHHHLIGCLGMEQLGWETKPGWSDALGLAVMPDCRDLGGFVAAVSNDCSTPHRLVLLHFGYVACTG